MGTLCKTLCACCQVLVITTKRKERLGLTSNQSMIQGLDLSSPALKLNLHNAIPVPKTLVTGLAVGELARKASGTLVTADTRHSLLTNTVACHSVALRGLNPTPVTVTCYRGENERIVSREQLELV